MSFYMSESNIKQSIEFNLKNIEDEKEMIDLIEKQIIADLKHKKPKYDSESVKKFNETIKRYKENIIEFERIIKARTKQLESGLSVEDAFNLVDQEADGQFDMFNIGGASFNDQN